MPIEQQLTTILRTRTSGPFLFVGSGFSRRYLGLEDWPGLLSRFCANLRPFEYYRSTANGNLPTAAKLIATEFNEHWWTAPDYANSVIENKSLIQDSTSALRIEISKYLSNLDPTEGRKTGYTEEIELLASLNVDGIITTNWDLFLEHLFPDYRTYIGQNELLFSNPQEIGEIYKIHGCASIPSSLVLTADDYVNFGERNPYLAAKLITVFVEHPVIFIGYSLSDPNVTSLLQSISLCVGNEQIEQLRKNLIFVQRLREGESPGISETYLTINGVQLPIVLVRTNNFAEVYRALSATRRKIPARVLRYCKEQLYELVKSSEPEKKLSVVDLDEIENKEDVEFLVGVGVAAAGNANIDKLGVVGYEVLGVTDLIVDLITNDKDFDAQKILDHVAPRLLRNTPYVPIFKYLYQIGITSLDSYKASGLQLDKRIFLKTEKFQIKQYASAFKKMQGKSMQEIITGSTPEHAAIFIPFLEPAQIDAGILNEFLRNNLDKVDNKTHPYATYFKKLAALYDRLVWGWN